MSRALISLLVCFALTIYACESKKAGPALVLAGVVGMFVSGMAYLFN